MKTEEKEALKKSGRENFAGGYADLGIAAGINPSSRDKLKEVGYKLCDAFTQLGEVVNKKP